MSSSSSSSSSLTVLLWSVLLAVLASGIPALAHNPTGNRNESLPCGVGFMNTTRIEGGFNVSPGRYPFMVNLRYYRFSNYHICNGVIINASYILTSRYCFKDFNTQHFGWLEVIIGDHTQTVFGDGERKVLAYPPILHGVKGDEDWFNDIALIQTKQPMKFFLNHLNGLGSVNRICMPGEGDLLPQTNLVGLKTVLAGWSVKSTVLQELSMEVIKCPVLSPNDLYQKQICARIVSPGKASSASGGPLFWISPEGRAHLIGIYSQLREDKLIGAVDVRLHLDWIKGNL